MKEKTYVEDVNRSIYDIRNEEKDVYRVKEGLTPEIVDQISKEKHDPDWMREFRQEALKVYNEMTMPDWGPSIEDLNMDEIVTYVRPNTQMSAKWSEVPTDIKIRLKHWASRMQSVPPWRASAHSMILNWFITTCAKRLQHRALYTRIWKAR